jgi:hypothetical protein
VRKWLDFNDLKMVVLHGDDKDELVKEDADIYVINPEGMPWLIYDTNFFKRVQPDTLTIDDRKYKNTNSAGFKMIEPLLPHFTRRWTLTGTPSSNGYLDVFGQIYVTDLGASLGHYFTAYRNTYFDAEGMHGWALREGSDKLIQKRLRSVVTRIDIGDFVHVPTAVLNPIYVDLPPKIRTLYDEFERDLYVELGQAKSVTALSAASAMIKCAQIASGGIYVDPEQDDKGLFRKIGKRRETVQLHDAKTDALENLHEELGYKPLFVAYIYNHDLDRLRDRFGGELPVLGAMGGGTRGMKYDAELERLWNKGLLPMLAGQPASVGHGLNLQEAGQDVCWYSHTYDLELFIQFNKRVVRQGNKHKVCRIHQLITRATTDEPTLAALALKDRSQQSLLDALRDYGTFRGYETANLNPKPKRGNTK